MIVYASKGNEMFYFKIYSASLIHKTDTVQELRIINSQGISLL